MGDRVRATCPSSVDVAVHGSVHEQRASHATGLQNPAVDAERSQVSDSCDVTVDTQSPSNVRSSRTGGTRSDQPRQMNKMIPS